MQVGRSSWSAADATCLTSHPRYARVCTHQVRGNTVRHRQQASPQRLNSFAGWSANPLMVAQSHNSSAKQVLHLQPFVVFSLTPQATSLPHTHTPCLQHNCQMGNHTMGGQGCQPVWNQRQMLPGSSAKGRRVSCQTCPVSLSQPWKLACPVDTWDQTWTNPSTPHDTNGCTGRETLSSCSTMIPLCLRICPTLVPDPLHHIGCSAMATSQGLCHVALSPRHGFHISTISNITPPNSTRTAHSPAEYTQLLAPINRSIGV